MTITESSHLIKKAVDQKRLLNNAEIETKSIVGTFSDAIKVAKGLNNAVQNMCPQCLELVQKALSEEEKAPTIQQSIIKGGSMS